MFRKGDDLGQAVRNMRQCPRGGLEGHIHTPLACSTAASPGFLCLTRGTEPLPKCSACCWEHVSSQCREAGKGNKPSREGWININAKDSLEPCLFHSLQLKVCQLAGIFCAHALLQTSVGLLIAFLPTLVSFFLYSETISLMVFFKWHMCVTVFSSLCSWNIYQ